MTQQNRLEQLALVSLTEEECPSPEQLADYILNTLVGTQHAIVAAHVRQCPLCQHETALCRPPEPRPRLLVARLMPIALAPGYRSAASPDLIRRYLAADVAIELLTTLPEGRSGRITGHVFQATTPVSGCSLLLRSRRRHFTEVSDDQGIFSFENLPEGRYTLSVTLGAMVVQIRNLQLRFEQQ